MEHSMLTLPPADDTSGHPPRQHSLRRRLLVWLALLLPLLGVAAFLVLIVQPFADAAGGCGGG